MEGSEIPANDNYEVADDSAAVEAAEAEPPVEGDVATEAGVETEAIEEGDEETAIDVAEGEAPLVIPRAANDDVAGLNANAEDGTPVIGRLDDTKQARDWDGYQVQDMQANPNANEYWEEAHQAGAAEFPPGWTPDNNQAWVESIIDQRQSVYLGSPEGGNEWDHQNMRETVYKNELNQLRAAGYRRVGDYMVPPDR